MMFLDLAKKRSSVRTFSPQPVARDALKRCVEAARLAPSACNSQPWSFVIVDDPRLKDALADALFFGPYAMNRFAKQAGALVVVVAEKPTGLMQVGSWLRKTPFFLIDVGIAAEHFVLQATEEGLGTCWIGWFDEKAAKRLLGIHASQRVCCVIAVGHPDEPPKEKIRKGQDAISRFNV